MSSTKTKHEPQVETQPETTASQTVANRIESGMSKVREWKGKAFEFAKQRPKTTAAVGIALLCACAYFYFSGPSGVPLAQANLPAQAQKVQSSGNFGTETIVVGSYRKTDSLLIMNNNRDYRQATMSVVIDLKACPELNSLNPRTLRGRTVRAKGEYQTYEGRPQIKVTRANDITVDPTEPMTIK